MDVVVIADSKANLVNAVEKCERKLEELVKTSFERGEYDVTHERYRSSDVAGLDCETVESLPEATVRVVARVHRDGSLVGTLYGTARLDV